VYKISNAFPAILRHRCPLPAITHKISIVPAKACLGFVHVTGWLIACGKNEGTRTGIGQSKRFLNVNQNKSYLEE